MFKRCSSHRWKEKKRTAIHSYQECSRCGKRKSIYYSKHEYEKPDKKWLKEKRNGR